MGGIKPQIALISQIILGEVVSVDATFCCASGFISMFRCLLILPMLVLPLLGKEETLHGSHHVEARFDPLVVPDRAMAFDDGPFVLPEFEPKFAEQSVFILENPEAQKWFRQGIALFYHGESWEAQRCFRLAVTIAPDSAMGFFGLALANEAVPGRAAMFVRQAAELAGNDGVGRGLIDAYARFFSDLRGDREAADIRLLRDLEQLVLAFPDQVEVQALVVRLLARPDVKSPLPLEALINQVLATCPKHPVTGYRAEIWQAFDRQRASSALEDLLEGGPSLAAATWERAMHLNLVIGRYDLASGCLAMVSGHEMFQASLHRQRAEMAPRRSRGFVRDVDRMFLDAHEARARQIIDLYGEGEKAEAFKRFDENFRYSCGLLEPKCVGELHPIAAEMKLPKRWDLRATTGLGAHAAGALISWATLPVPSAPNWILADEGEALLNPNQLEGDVRVFVFFLGAACDHCMGQLQGFALNAEAFGKAGVPIVAVSTDAVGKLSEMRTKEGKEFPFPIVSDAALDNFKAYMAYDQFSERALHATVVVDAEGEIFWRRVGGQPFHDVGEVLKQAKQAGESR